MSLLPAVFVIISLIARTRVLRVRVNSKHCLFSVKQHTLPVHLGGRGKHPGRLTVYHRHLAKRRRSRRAAGYDSDKPQTLLPRR